MQVASISRKDNYILNKRKINVKTKNCIYLHFYYCHFICMSANFDTNPSF